MFFTQPLAALAGCARCPADCPMHAKVESPGDAPQHDADAHAAHAGHAAHAEGAAHHDHANHGEHHARAGQAEHRHHVADGDHGAAGADEAHHDHANHAPAANAPSLHEGGGARLGHDGPEDDCHRRARAARAAAEDGPCLTAACGHHDVVLTPVLPEALVTRVPAPGLVSHGAAIARVRPPLVAVDPPDPPTDPPRRILG